jgi:hypothetical protein
MKLLHFLSLLTLMVSTVFSFSASPTNIDDPVEGQKLARELRSVFPAENAKMTGVLRIAPQGAEHREVQMESRVEAGKESWNSIYIAILPGASMETLTVRHSTNAPNAYEWQQGDKSQKLEGSNATNRFAGSDFALLDLGLEFFHWPTQILITREMRKGRGCDVLESRPAKTNYYSRVRSWIDQESRAQGQPGLIMAEAWDANGKLIKEFEITGLKGKQVSEMEIRNRQTRSSTRIRFQFE